jgi:hypothetical protein
MHERPIPRRGCFNRINHAGVWLTRTLAILTVLAASGGQGPSQAGTNHWTGSGPYGGQVTVLAIDPQTPANLYAAGFSGVFKSADGGANWARASTGITDPSVGALVIDPVTPTTLYAGSIQGGPLVKSVDGANTWTPTGPTLVTALAINPQAPATIYAARQQAGISRSTDGGATWAAVGVASLPSFPTFKSIVIDPKTPSTLYAGERSAGVYKSVDGGATWTAANVGFNGPTIQILKLAIDPQTPSTLYAAASTSNGAGLYKSTNGAASWTQMYADNSGVIGVQAVTVDPQTPTTVYIGTFGQGVLRSANGGTSFAAINTGLPKVGVNVIALNPKNPASLIAGTQNGVFTSANAGVGWIAASNGLALTTVTAVAVDPLTPTTIYAGTKLSGLFKSVDGGSSWQSINRGVPATGNLACSVASISSLAIDPVTPTTLYAGTQCTQNSQILRSVDGGASWTAASNGLPTFVSISTLAIDPQATSSIFALTESGQLFQTTNAGANWAPVAGIGSGEYVTALSIAVLPPSASINAATIQAKRRAQIGVALSGARPTLVSATGGTGGTTVVSVTTDQGGLKILKDDGKTFEIVTNFCTETLRLLSLWGESQSALELFMTCISTEARPVEGSNPPEVTDSNGVTYVFPDDGATTSVANVARTALLEPRPTAINLVNPVVTPWSPPGGDNSMAAACSPVGAVIADPLEADSFYGGAACGVLKGTNGGRQLITMSAGLPPNLQVNALSITPAGDTLYAGTASGGVFAFTFGASVPNYQGLWWNPDESGWGINFAHQGDIIFATWFTYDAAGKPWWLIAELHKSAAGTYAGPVSTVVGPPFNAVPFAPAPVETQVGAMTATFADAKHASISYTVNGVSQTKAIVPQQFGTLPTCVWGAPSDLTLATNYTDLWWNPNESGWGINFAHQGDVIFATWFTYDASGKPWWLIAELHKGAAKEYTGGVSTVSGAPFIGVAFDSSKVVETPAGTAAATFTNGNAATFAYTVNGAAGSKAVTRQVFMPPGTSCQ